jgi:EmrB/QacA subfamily drug resistance transporter
MSEASTASSGAPGGLVQRRRSLVLAACMMASFIAAVEGTIIGTAMPTIVAQLGDFHLFSWVFGAYLLAQAVSVPIYGRLCDLYGRKRIFFAGLAVFLVGSTLCGFAHGMISLIVFRAIQGAGAGAVQPVAYTIVGDIYTPTERARIQGVLSSVYGISGVIGPSLGAFLVENAHWSVVFWINIPIGLIAAGMLAVFFREKAHEQSRRIDYLASLLLAIGCGALMMALIQASTLPAWLLVICIVVGIAALAALMRYERHAEAPMLPLKMWADRVIALGNLGSFTIGIAMMGVSVFLPTYVQAVMGRSPAAAAIVLGMMPIGWSVASNVSGRLMLRTSYRLAAVSGGVLFGIGATVLALMPASSSAVWPCIGCLLFGLGMGFCNTTYIISVQAAARARDRGAAAASNVFMRLVGQSAGAALFGAMVNTGLTRYAPQAHEVAERLMDRAVRPTLSAPELAHLVSALAAAIHNVYVFVVVLSVVALLLGAALPRRLSPRNPS